MPLYFIISHRSTPGDRWLRNLWTFTLKGFVPIICLMKNNFIPQYSCITIETLIISSKMLMLHVYLISFLLNSVDGNKVISVERNEHYNQVIPVGLDLFLGDQSNFSLIECLVHCEMIASECLGTFYNRILRSCKFMSYPGNMELALTHQVGSAYYSINREY